MLGINKLMTDLYRNWSGVLRGLPHRLIALRDDLQADLQ